MSKNNTYDVNDELIDKNGETIFILNKDLTIGNHTGMVCVLVLNTDSAAISFRADFLIKRDYELTHKSKNNTPHTNITYCDICQHFMPFYNDRCLRSILSPNDHIEDKIIISKQYIDITGRLIKSENVSSDTCMKEWDKHYNGYTNQTRIEISHNNDETDEVQSNDLEHEQASLFELMKDEYHKQPTIKQKSPPLRHKKDKKSDYAKKIENSLKERIVKEMLRRAKKRAEEKGWEFNLEPSDITIPEVCPITKKPFYIALDSNGLDPYSPSLDRKDSTKGYVKGNVAVISHWANSRKKDFAVEELIALGEYLKMEQQNNAHS